VPRPWIANRRKGASHLDTAFEALRPEEIGVHLPEGDMMDPEASVSALVFHHPDARSFGV
jgi:cobalamin-dependent methionine synthase I